MLFLGCVLSWCEMGVGGKRVLREGVVLLCFMRLSPGGGLVL